MLLAPSAEVIKVKPFAPESDDAKLLERVT